MKFKANLYYAMGGGLGHLTRARAVEYTLGLENLRVLTADTEANKVFHSHNLLKVPPKHFAPGPYQKWMDSRLNRYEFSAIYLDTFPAGLLGELATWLGKWEGKLHYIARAVDMERIRSRIPDPFPQIETSYVVDELPAAQMEFLQAHSKSVEQIHLGYPQPEIPAPILDLFQRLSRPIWLIVHGGPASEVDELLAFARGMAKEELAQPSWVICTLCEYSSIYRDVQLIRHFPIWPIFGQVDRIFTGCGFNSMLQTEPFQDKHHFLPFERRYDDQFARAKRREAG